MDRIIKAVIFGGKARVAIVDTTQAVNESIQIHNLSPLAAAALGRSLTVGAYISANLKGDKDKFSIIIDGGGQLGKIIIAGESKGAIRGYVANPSVQLSYKDGKLDVGGAVGTKGDITIIKDLGLKEPYVGRCKLVSGEIAEDFANYLLKSEGIPSAVALGVLNDKEGCRASGGVIVEAMPDADDGDIFVLEDIMTNFQNISSLLAAKSAEEVMDFYFGHLDAEIFEAEPIKLVCRCADKIKSVVRTLGRDEAAQIIEEAGKIEVRCDFCNKTYTYFAGDLDEIFIEV